MKKIVRVGLLPLALTLAASACAGDEEGDEDTTTTEAAASDDETTTSTADVMEDDKKDGEEDPDAEGAEAATVADIVSGSPDHTTLLAALEKAELVEALQGDGPFTVFAPTDAAFEAYLTEADITAEELLENEALADILSGHVVALEVPSSAISEEAAELETLAGTSIEAILDGGTATVGGAEVSAADLAAGNGVVHVIDSVIAPE